MFQQISSLDFSYRGGEAVFISICQSLDLLYSLWGVCFSSYRDSALVEPSCHFLYWCGGKFSLFRATLGREAISLSQRELRWFGSGRLKLATEHC